MGEKFGKGYNANPDDNMKERIRAGTKNVVDYRTKKFQGFLEGKKGGMMGSVLRCDGEETLVHALYQGKKKGKGICEQYEKGYMKDPKARLGQRIRNGGRQIMDDGREKAYDYFHGGRFENECKYNLKKVADW